MFHLTNVTPSPITAEIVALAAKHTGFKVEYRNHPITLDQMDWFDAAEAWDDGYTGTNGDHSIWSSEAPGKGHEVFWREYERLEKLITKPLNEPVLPDDQPVYQGYLYVVNGNRVVEFIDGQRQTVGTWKQMRIKGVPEVTEVRRCDIEGRRLRLPPEKEKITPLREAWFRRGSTNKLSENQKRRKPRNSNKIKKVK